MTPRINLLPSSYRHARRQDRRFRVGMIVCTALLLSEIAAGLVLHAGAEDTRELLTAARRAEDNAQALKKDLESPAQQAEQLGRHLQLAERLRSKHRWSRLLATMTRAVPERVVLSSIMTEPAQWSTSLQAGPVALSAGAATAVNVLDNRRLIDALVVQGRAADHGDLAAFISGVHATRMFATIELKQARREKFMDKEAITFELSCRW